MFFISKEDQEQVYNRFNIIRKLANDFYLEYLNNYLTSSLIAEHYEISEELANELLFSTPTDFIEEEIIDDELNDWNRSFLC